jgi:FkbM family methyltransferase
MIYRQLMTRLHPNQVRVNGHLIRLDSMDSLLLSVNGNYERTELELFRECIRPGDTVLDIGAHIGLYTLEAARATGSEGRVHAFEPSNANYNLLVENISANGYRNVSVVKAAVSDTVGDAVLSLSSENTGDHSLSKSPQKGRQWETVETVTIDDYLASRGCSVNVIKMDVQGAEMLALLGAQRTLAANMNLIVFTELSPLHLRPWGGAGRYLRLLEQSGFLVFEIDESSATVQNRTTADLIRLVHDDADEYRNLLCIKGDRARERFELATAHVAS